MSLFKKLFGASESSDDDKDGNLSPFNPETVIPADELFTLNFKKNGGKFLYCENLEEAKDHFEHILEENDWFESEALCFEPKLFSLLDENKLSYTKPANPRFLLASCENLIADEGSVLFHPTRSNNTSLTNCRATLLFLPRRAKFLPAKATGFVKSKENTKRITLPILPQ